MNDVEVKVTGHSHSAQKTLHYINYGIYNDDYAIHLNQPHKNENGITKRNYLLTGINCHASYKKSLKDFNVYLAKKPHNKVQTLNVVLSFGHKLDWRKSEDRFEGYTLARKFVGKAFPNHQAVIAEQMDNKGMQAHIHCIVNAISMKFPYNTIPGGHSKQWYQNHPNVNYQPVSYGVVHLRNVVKSCIKDINNNDKGFTHHFSDVTKFNKSNEVNHNITLNYYQKYVSKNVINALKNIHNNNKDKLRKALRPKGILVSFKRQNTRRRRKRGKRRHRSRYRHGGLVFRVDTLNGSVLDFRHDMVRVKKSHRHYIKSSVLARKQPSLSYKHVIDKLTTNQSTLNRQHDDATKNVHKSDTNSVQPSMASSSSSSNGSAISSSYDNDDYGQDFEEFLYSQINSDYKLDQSLRASESLSASASASARQSASVSISASVSADPVASRNSSASSARSLADSSYSSQLSTISGNSSKSISSAQNVAIQPKWLRSMSKFDDLKTDKHLAKVHERKRVTNIMPKFSSRRAQRYAWWNYGHAIPAHCIGYDKKIPEFAVSHDDKKLLAQLSDTIIERFQAGKRWALAEWNAGKSAISEFIRRHNIKTTISWWVDPHGMFTGSTGYPNHKVTSPMNVEDMAHEEPHSIIRGYNHVAKKFNNAWNGIKSAFNSRIIEPTLSKFNSARNNASSASSARERALSNRSSITSEAKASAANASSTAMASRNHTINLINSESSSASKASFEATSAGKSSIASQKAFEHSLDNYYASVSSAISKSKALSKSSRASSISASKSSWTSSANDLDYNNWVGVRGSVATDHLYNNSYYDGHIRHYEPYQDSVINNLGSQKRIRYRGINDSHDKNTVYCNRKYYNKLVTFNKCSNLLTNDTNTSQSANRRIRRNQHQHQNIDHSPGLS